MVYIVCTLIGRIFYYIAYYLSCRFSHVRRNRLPGSPTARLLHTPSTVAASGPGLSPLSCAQIKDNVTTLRLPFFRECAHNDVPLLLEKPGTFEHFIKRALFTAKAPARLIVPRNAIKR